MKQAIKKKWVEALRSGKYKQGREWLCYQDEYCCLGVLCEVMKVKKLASFNNYITYGTQKDNGYGDLPEYVKKKSGLDKETQDQLIDLNDGKNGDKTYTFKQIANWIERNL